MTDERIIIAEKSARLLEEITPALEKLEAEAFENALACNRATDDGRMKADDELRMVSAIRRLKDKLKMDYLVGKEQAKRENQGRMVA